MECLEDVDDDHAGSAFADEVPDPVEDPGQAVLVQDRTKILVLDATADCCGALILAG